MKLYYGDKEIDLPVDSESYSYEGVMVLRELTLQFSSCEFIEIPVGAHCEFNGVRYFLEKPENFTKEGKRNFRYTLLLSSDDSKTTLWKVRNPIDKRIKFSYTTTPREHVKLIVDCLNMHDAGWEVGECLEGETKTVNYNHTYILDGLNSLADLYKTEWEIDGKRVSLRKVEYNKENPLPLSYKGSSGSFKKGVGRESGEIPSEVILIEGTTKNIDFSKYGSETLLLPKGKTLEYNERLYMTDKDGTCVMRADTKQTTWKEDSLDCSEIIPARYGTVSEVIPVDASKNFYDFKDASIPENLDYSKYRISGETATIIFQTGMLAGQGEFEIEQDEDGLSGYVHGERRFKLVPQEVNGITMPNEVYKPSVGDKYAVFNIMLPDEYICDDESQTGASWDMFREAAKYLFEHEDKEFTFNGTLNGIWAKKRWLAIAGKIKVGGYTLFSDEQFHPEGSLIRITGIKRYVTNPFKPDLELSNCSVATSISSDLEKITSNEVTTDNLFKNSLQFTKRRYRDAIEAQEMLEKAFDNYSKGIDPIWVRTMSLLVGDESLQFRFVSSKTSPSTVEPNFVYNQLTQVFKAPKSILQHMTLGISQMKEEHKANEYKYWDLPDLTSPALGDFGAMYLYAKCSKSSQTGEFLLSETTYDMDEGGYYYFLVGLLGSQFDGARSFVTVYGFTEILPGRITVDRIVSTDGKTYFALNRGDGIGEIGGLIKFASGSTGYENLTDKPNLSIYGTISMLNAVKSDLQSQIDGKIETYYQSSNPWNSWPSGEEPTHVGDMWYNTSTNMLYRYVGPSSNTWSRIYDADAIAAAQAASTAQDTADGKRRVFLRTPYPPYDAGDQWIEYGGSGSMRICVQGRQSGSYYSGDWQISSADGNTQASIDRGVFTGAGFITFGPNGGGTAGMAGDGDIRIWSGGTNANDATFQVKDSGEVLARRAIKLQNNQAGITGEGPTDTSVRFWAGNKNPEIAPFRVCQNGMAYMSGGKIGRFSIEGIDSNNRGGRLTWNQADYFGGSSRSLKLGYSKDNEGVIDVTFNPGAEGRFGVKSVGMNLNGSAAIYGSTGSQTNPGSGMSYAGFFVGAVDVRDTNHGIAADVVTAKRFRVLQSRNSDGTYVYHEGVNWNKSVGSPDLDKIRLIVENGIITGYYGE